jgi:hypothetical protein
VARCPLCGARSRRNHSRYDRQVADLAGKEIRLRVITRRFICEVPHCRRRIFAERFEGNVLPTRSRRTARLKCIIHHLELVLGGRPACCQQRYVASGCTTADGAEPILTAVGIDDWAQDQRRRCKCRRCASDEFPTGDQRGAPPRAIKKVRSLRIVISMAFSPERPDAAKSDR